MERETKKQMSFGIVLSYMIIIAQFATGLLYTPIVLKTLGQSQYGIYSLCTSFMGYLTIMNSGANAAYIRFYVQTKEKNPKKIPGLNGVFLKIFTSLAFLALIGGLLIGMFSPQIFGSKISSSEYEIVRLCFTYLAINSSVQVLNCVFGALTIANEKFIFGKTVNLVVSIMNPLITTPFLLAGFSCVVIIQIHLITMLCTLGFNALYCFFRLKIKFSLKDNDKILLKNIAQFAGFIVLQSIMDQVNWQIDKFILARLQGTSEISIYSVGSTFNKYYITFAGALSGVFIAQVNKLQVNGQLDKTNELFVRSSRLFSYFIWLFMSAYMVFGHEFVIRWAGIEYDISYAVGWLLMLPVTASLTMGLAQDIARAMNKHQLQIVINFVICIINGLVSIPLAMKWGAVGSAAGTFAAEICMCIIVEPIYYKRVLGLDIKNLIVEIGKIFRGLIIPIVFGLLLNYIHVLRPNYSVIAFWGIIYITVYGVSMWIFAMDDYEKQFVKKILLKVMKR